MGERKTLVLDLDETLIHSDENLSNFDFEVGPFKTKIRPHLEEFLSFALDTFDVGIWSSGSLEYVFLVLENLSQLVPMDNSLAFVWGRERCTRTFFPNPGMYTSEFYEWTKPFHKLRRAGYKKATTIAVDDTPAKWCMSYGNLVRVNEFTDDPNDKELLKLMIYLNRLNKLDDIIHVDKRKWHMEIAQEFSEQFPILGPTGQQNQFD